MTEDKIKGVIFKQDKNDQFVLSFNLTNSVFDTVFGTFDRNSRYSCAQLVDVDIKERWAKKMFALYFSQKTREYPGWGHFYCEGGMYSW